MTTREDQVKSYKEVLHKASRLNVKECYEKVQTEDIGRLSIAQDILRNKYSDFLRRIIAPN